MQPVQLDDLGLADYKVCWDHQEKLFNGLVELKLRNRGLPGEQQEKPLHHLLFCEHPHVYTLGKSGKEHHLLLNREGLKEQHTSFYRINRGGDITYHGPGQVVGYPILDLDCFFTDIHKYLRYLEEVIIRTLNEYGIRAARYPGYTGVWIDPEDPRKARKICSMGIRSSRWVTMHGFALNVNTDLSFFQSIVPCGIPNVSVTSVLKETGTPADMNEVKQKIKTHFAELFDVAFVEKSRSSQ